MSSAGDLELFWQIGEQSMLVHRFVLDKVDTVDVGISIKLCRWTIRCGTVADVSGQSPLYGSSHRKLN